MADSGRSSEDFSIVACERRNPPSNEAVHLSAVPRGNARSAALSRAYISCTEGALTPVFGGFAEKARDAGWPVREIATGSLRRITVSVSASRDMVR